MTTDPPAPRTAPVCPFDLHLDVIGGMLNVELADDPVYSGLEIQTFDDPEHGRGLLAFVTRRGDGRADVYREPGLRVDPRTYQVGHGIGRWVEATMDPARLRITPFGVDVAVRFRDDAGRPIEVRVDDRSRRRRRPARLLAPFGAAVEHPSCLLLAYMRHFDLVRRDGTEPRLTVDGRPARTGSLPGSRLHGRPLIKYAAGIVVLRMNDARDGPIPAAAPGAVELDPTGTGIAAVTATRGPHRACLRLDPPLPDLAGLPDRTATEGRWVLELDEMALGGSWSAHRDGDRTDLVMDVTRGWRPAGLPLLMRVMTSVVRVFRTWPTTYRWSATVSLPERTMRSRWERTTEDRDSSYRRLTGSAPRD